ncbi:MAG: ComEC family competence protein [Candidatus Obscuribacterales bacterium]|nr:ComEC family competence protein [Candidatus Obscuribacterales bacterium]
MKSQSVTVVASLSFAIGCFLVVDQTVRLQFGDFIGLLQQCFHNALLALISVSSLIWLLLRLGGKKSSAWIVACLPTLGMVYTTMHLSTTADLARLTKKGYIECVCIVDSPTNSNSYICRPLSLVHPSRKKLCGQSLLIVSGSKSPTIGSGQYVKVFGKVSRIVVSPNRWHFDANRRLIGKGIVTIIRSYGSDIRLLGSDGSRSTLESARHTVISAHERALGVEKGDLLSAMVLGDRVVHLSRDLKEKFRVVGLSHLLAASGLNLSIVVAASYFIARMARLPAILRIGIAAISTISFVCLAGPSPSVLRAAILCGLFLTAKLFARRLHSAAALSITLWIALLADPLSLSDIGLQLSYAATGSIIIGARRLSSNKENSWIEKIIIWLRDTVMVIVLAQLAVLPLQLLHFQSAGLLFLPANLMVDPVVAPITLLAFVSSISTLLFKLIPSSSAVCNWITQSIDSLTSWPLDYMIQCASAFASIKGAMLHLPPPVAGAVPIYYGCLLSYFHLSSKATLRLLGFVILLVGIAILFFRPSTPGQLTFVSRTSVMTIQHRTVLAANVEGLDWLSRQFLSFAGSTETVPQPMQSFSQLTLPSTEEQRTGRHRRKRRRDAFKRFDTRYSSSAYRLLEQTNDRLNGTCALKQVRKRSHTALSEETAANTVIDAVDAGDFVVVGRRHLGLLSALDSSQLTQLEKLIADTEIKLGPDNLQHAPVSTWSKAIKDKGKPILVWSTGRSNAIIQSPWLPETYLAYAGPGNALILAQAPPYIVAHQPKEQSGSISAIRTPPLSAPSDRAGSLTDTRLDLGAIVRSAIGVPRRTTFYYPFLVKNRIGKIGILY